MKKTRFVSDRYLPKDVKIDKNKFTLVIATEDEEFDSSNHDTIEQAYQSLRDTQEESTWYFHALYCKGRIVNFSEEVVIKMEDDNVSGKRHTRIDLP